MKFSYLFLLMILLSTACGDSNGNDQQSDFEAALPHTGVSSDTEMTEAEMKKVLAANGRTATPLSFAELVSRLGSDKSSLHLVNFWTLGCEECLQMNQHLQQINNQLSDSNIKVWLVSLDGPGRKDRVTLHLRMKNLTEEVVLLSDQPESYMTKDILGVDKLEGPGLWMIHGGQGVDLFYPRSMDIDEIQAVLQPMLIGQE